VKDIVPRKGEVILTEASNIADLYGDYIDGDAEMQSHLPNLDNWCEPFPGMRLTGYVQQTLPRS
jgi:hypothetical protein